MTFLEQISAIAPIIAVGLLVLGIFSLLFAGRSFHKSRTRSFWRQRRAAGQQGLRFLIAGVLLIAASPIAAGFAIFKPTPLLDGTTTLEAVITTPEGGNPEPSATLEVPTETPFPMPVVPTSTPERTLIVPSLTPSLPATDFVTAAVIETSKTLVDPTSTLSLTPTVTASYTLPPTLTATLTPTFTATFSPTPTLTMSFTPTPTETVTLTPSHTPTPTNTLIPVSILNAPTLESSVTPLAGARFTIYALDTQISGDGMPVAPAIDFGAGFTRIYYFVSSTRLTKGVVWRRELWRGDTLLQNSEYLWAHAEDGNSFYFFGLSEGFQPGEYQIRLYIGRNTSVPAASAVFRVK